MKFDHNVLGNFALNGAVALKRDLGDLLELESMLFFELLERRARHVHELAARRGQLQVQDQRYIAS